MTKSTLISRAINGLQIRRQGDVYQVIQAPFGPQSQPLFTTRDLERAKAWRSEQGAR